MPHREIVEMLQVIGETPRKLPFVPNDTILGNSSY